MTNSDPLYLRVMDRRRRGPADTTTSRPVNSYVRTRRDALANFRLCARKGLVRRSENQLLKASGPYRRGLELAVASARFT